MCAFKEALRFLVPPVSGVGGGTGPTAWAPVRQKLELLLAPALRVALHSPGFLPCSTLVEQDIKTKISACIADAISQELGNDAAESVSFVVSHEGKLVTASSHLGVDTMGALLGVASVAGPEDTPQLVGGAECPLHCNSQI